MGNGSDGTLHSKIIEENLWDAYAMHTVRVKLLCGSFVLTYSDLFEDFVIYVDSYGVNLKRQFVSLECI